MAEAIVNKVAGSGLLTIDLEQFLPIEEIISFDLKKYLFMGLILKEKDYREALKNLNLQHYAGKNVVITCTADAIIPVWAYMLAATHLQPVAKDIYVGSAEEMYKHLIIKSITSLNANNYTDQRVVIKGCGDTPIDVYAYAEITKVLLPVVKSIMYGEPCSTVPVFEKPKLS